MERHRKNLLRNVLRIGTIFVALTAACFGATAQTTLDAMMQREIVVGTKEAAPFSMKNADGNWVGISIDLWRRIADEKKIRYRIVETDTVPDLIAASWTVSSTLRSPPLP